MLNHIVVMGRLTRDPELRSTQTGVPVVSFSLAVERDFTDKESGNKQTDFIDVVAWRSTAEFIARNFSRGKMAVASGRLQIREWQDKDGAKRRSAEIVVDNIYFGESRRDVEERGERLNNYSGGYNQGGGGYNQGGYGGQNSYGGGYQGGGQGGYNQGGGQGGYGGGQSSYNQGGYNQGGGQGGYGGAQGGYNGGQSGYNQPQTGYNAPQNGNSYNSQGYNAYPSTPSVNSGYVDPSFPAEDTQAQDGYTPTPSAPAVPAISQTPAAVPHTESAFTELDDPELPF